ncbi:MAG: hypothetical protein ACTHJM_00995 [Marmoricola sp.]
MTTLRRRVSATAVLLLVPTLAACGFGVQTNKQYQSGAGVDNRDGIVQILNAAVIIPAAGSTDGTFVGSFVNTSGSDPATQASYTPGQAATVESISITTPAGGTVDPKITLAPSTSYNPQPADQPGDHGVAITVPANLAQGANPADGAYVTMKFVINTGSAQTITMRVPVFPASDPNNYWAKYLVPTGTTTPTGSATPTATATP